MNNLKLLSLFSVLFAFSFSAPAVAASHAKQQAPVVYSSNSTPSGIQWGVSGPFALIGSTACFGAFVTGDYWVTKDITIGGESGFLIGSNVVTIWDIPIVLTGKYHFALQGAPNLRPFVGAGMGLGILHAGGTASIGGVTIANVPSATSAEFQGEIKAGTAFQDGPGLMAELRLGIVNSSFLFAPSIGYNF